MRCERIIPSGTSYPIPKTALSRLRSKSNIENYLKPFVDDLTCAQLLSIDDRQIDELQIERSRDTSKEESEVILSIETFRSTKELVPKKRPLGEMGGVRRALSLKCDKLNCESRDLSIQTLSSVMVSSS